ncbi:hypothetical protein ABZS98_39375 [Streptomyces avermitilis]|uniref:hypothetical protein n=1 Tax=Streptomyces avermitilis TaxID=33903 RepID=UPI0033AC2636
MDISEALGALVILKAFAAGCSALTGIEAIADGVPVFRPPRAHNAQRTELMLGGRLRRDAHRTVGTDSPRHATPGGGFTVLDTLTQAAGEDDVTLVGWTRDQCLKASLIFAPACLTLPLTWSPRPSACRRRLPVARRFFS